jgi:hypothetical protein
MATTIKVGTVFIQDRPRILRTLALESEPYGERWILLRRQQAQKPLLVNSN